MDTRVPTFKTLSQGNKVIESHFTPWVEANGARYLDLPVSDLDRKFGIDGIVINLDNGKSRTVQVKQDCRISETGNIYLEVAKVLCSDRKKVIAQQIYCIDTKTNKMYSMGTAELQADGTT